MSCSVRNFAIRGTVENLVGEGLELTNNTTDRLEVEATGATANFRFPTAVPSGSTYDVRVAKNPTKPLQTCAVTPETATGTVLDVEVDSVRVNCVTLGYTISVTVTGLRGSPLVLQNNGGDDLPIASNGIFRFATPLPTGATYSVRGPYSSHKSGSLPLMRSLFW